MSIQAVIWDFGGVLVRTEDYEPRRRWAERLGMSLAELAILVFGIRDMRAQRGDISVDEQWEAARSQLDLDQETFDAMLDDFFAGDVLDEALIERIRALKPKRKTAILSNAFGNLRAYLNDELHIADAFDEIIISAELGVTKPDARIYHLALEKLAVQPQEAVFIDDTLENVEGARAVGMHAIHFRDRDQTLAELDSLLDEEGNQDNHENPNG
jgi:epoxide hydrolase-like predicted phosphatase